MQITISTAGMDDLPFLLGVERHLSPAVIEQKVSSGEILVAHNGQQGVAYLRYALFWDLVPFMNLLWVIEGQRRRGIGSRIVAHWEFEMAQRGYAMVMTSTQANEDAQHFYRRLGYRDIGGFVLPDEPMELLLMKMMKVSTP